MLRSGWPACTQTLNAAESPIISMIFCPHAGTGGDDETATLLKWTRSMPIGGDERLNQRISALTADRTTVHADWPTIRRRYSASSLSLSTTETIDGPATAQAASWPAAGPSRIRRRRPGELGRRARTNRRLFYTRRWTGIAITALSRVGAPLGVGCVTGLPGSRRRRLVSVGQVH